MVRPALALKRTLRGASHVGCSMCQPCRFNHMSRFSSWRLRVGSPCQRTLVASTPSIASGHATSRYAVRVPPASFTSGWRTGGGSLLQARSTILSNIESGSAPTRSGRARTRRSRAVPLGPGRSIRSSVSRIHRSLAPLRSASSSARSTMSSSFTTAPRSQSVRAMFVHGMLSTRVWSRSSHTPSRWRATPGMCGFRVELTVASTSGWARAPGPSARRRRRRGVRRWLVRGGCRLRRASGSGRGRSFRGGSAPRARRACASGG